MQNRFRVRGWNGERYRYDLQENEVPLSEYANGWMYELEQCTGLKDKNGNLIYEGDRVKFNKNGNRKGCIIWYLSSWGIETTSEFIPMEGQFAINDPRDIEVIGNIHENPDLLENKE